MTKTKAALILCLAVMAAAFLGYCHGCIVTQDSYSAKLAALEKTYAEGEAARALALVDALQKLKETYQKQVTAAGQIEKELVHAHAENDALQKKLSKRIVYAAHTSDATCSGLSDDWLLTYNEATGAAYTATGDSRATGEPAGAATASGAAVSGLPRAAPLKLVTPADVLAHARDYGAYCRRLEAQVRGWQSYSEVIHER